MENPCVCDIKYPGYMELVIYIKVDYHEGQNTYNREYSEKNSVGEVVQHILNSIKTTSQ